MLADWDVVSDKVLVQDPSQEVQGRMKAEASEMSGDEECWSSPGSLVGFLVSTSKEELLMSSGCPCW